VEFNVELALNRFRNESTKILSGLPQPRGFENPAEGQSVLAADFLSHLDLDRNEINTVLREAYPDLDRIHGFKKRVHARLRFLVWMTVKDFNQIKPAYKLLRHDLDAQLLLGFSDGLPSYETLRKFINKLLTGARHEKLLSVLIVEQHRLLPTLGAVQVEDATPVQARRRETEAPYNPHYKIRMHKLELRWDIQREALLTQQFYHGTAGEGRWLTIFTDRLDDLGIKGTQLTIDGGYTSFLHIALQWCVGQPLSYKTQEGWKVDKQAAQESVLKRYQNLWQHPDFLTETPFAAKLRFLIDHGTEHDIDAAGRYIRDEYLTTKTTEEFDFVNSHRSQNEGLNAEYKQLPLGPARRGSLELLRRSQACCLTIHLVQLTRIQNGVSTHLCRVTNIL